jgi:hypothetical protein
LFDNCETIEEWGDAMNQAESRVTNTGNAPALVLGKFSVGHLGDVLCMTPLPRLLRAHLGLRVRIADAPVLRHVLANNPYIDGFVPAAGIPLHDRMRGFGHLIQRLQQGFGLPHDPIPRPEIYLSSEETEWARQERARWPAGKPACILSTRVITEARHTLGVDWPALGRSLARRYTLIQPVLTGVTPYQQQVDPRMPAGEWKADERVPSAVVYEDLPLRRFLALFSVADCFCGGMSGGSHAAAAFDLPSLIVIWRGLAAEMKFPISAQGMSPLVFLYPQHHFVVAEDLTSGTFDHAGINAVVDELAARASVRPPGLPPAAPAATIPFRPRFTTGAVVAARGRLVKFRRPPAQGRVG